MLCMHAFNQRGKGGKSTPPRARRPLEILHASVDHCFQCVTWADLSLQFFSFPFVPLWLTETGWYTTLGKDGSIWRINRFGAKIRGSSALHDRWCFKQPKETQTKQSQLDEYHFCVAFFFSRRHFLDYCSCLSRFHALNWSGFCIIKAVQKGKRRREQTAINVHL